MDIIEMVPVKIEAGAKLSETEAITVGQVTYTFRTVEYTARSGALMRYIDLTVPDLIMDCEVIDLSD